MSKWIMAAMLGAAGLFAVGLMLFGLPEKQAPGEGEPPFSVPDVPVDAQLAESVYATNCLSCHGDQLQGGVGPALAQAGSKLSREQIYKLIVSGQGIMPSFKDKLTEDEIVNLTNWLGEHK